MPPLTFKDRILYVCPHHGCRSSIAAYVSHQVSASRIDAYSACLNPGPRHRLPLAAMKMAGYEIPGDNIKSVFERFSNNEIFDYVITLCDDKGKEQAGLFLHCVDQLYANTAIRLSWSIGDFQALKGSDALQLEKAIAICGDIIKQVKSLNHILQDPARPTCDGGIHDKPHKAYRYTQLSSPSRSS